MNKLARRRLRAIPMTALALAAQQAMALQITADYVGPTGGQYATAANWSAGQVPVNGPTNTYVVNIGNQKGDIAYNIAGRNSIDQLSIDVGSGLSLSSPSVLNPTELTVLGTATIAGRISANGATFSATAAGTRLAGNLNQLSATGGGVVRIAAPSFDASGLYNTTLLSATGAGSLIDLSSAQSFNAGQGSVYNNTVSVGAGGRIDLSGVKTLTAAASATQLNFNVSGGGSLDFTRLQTLSGVTDNSGATNFNVDGGTVTLGALQKANRMGASLTNGATMTLSSNGAQASITNSLFGVSGGSKLNAAALKGTLDDSGVYNTTLLSVAGSGSVLDLSGISTFSAGQSSVYNNTVAVSGGGMLNLSGVTRLIAAQGATQLNFNVGSGGQLNLGGLQTLGGVTDNTGSTNFNVDGATVTVGALQKANRMGASLTNGATMTLSSNGAQASITNSLFGVSGGSKLNAAALKGTLDDSGVYNTTLLSVAGSGSVLDLSGINTFSAGQGSVYNNTVAVSGGGMLNLSGVTRLIAAQGASQLNFNVGSGGQLNLGALQTLGGVTDNTGSTNFNVDGGTVTVGALQKANRMGANLTNGATMTLSSNGAQASITNSLFGVSGGSTLNGSALKGTLDDSGVYNTTLLSASGQKSLLDLSALNTLRVQQTSVYANQVVASASGRIQLSSVDTLVAGAASGPLNISAQTGGSIDLGSLQHINTSYGGGVNFSVSGAGSLVLHGLQAPARVAFALADAGSTLTVNGGLKLMNGSTMSAGAGTTIAMHGDFSFEQTVASGMNTDYATLAFSGGGLDQLEVGGKHLGTLPTPGGAVTGNFAVGQLVVGQAGQVTNVMLVDAIDNGHRNPTEALYLNGSSSADGLHILGGSTLALDGLDLYTTQNGQWVHINDLFTGGKTVIAYDQGYISLLSAVPEPGTWAMWAAGLLAMGGRQLSRRRQTDSVRG